DEAGDISCTKVPFGGPGFKEPDDGFRCYVKDYEDGKIYEIVENLYSELGTGPAVGYGTREVDQLPVDATEVNYIGIASLISPNVGSWSIEDFMSEVRIPDVNGTSIWFIREREGEWPDFTLFTEGVSDGTPCDEYCSTLPEDEQSSCNHECIEGIAWMFWETKNEEGEYTGEWNAERIEWMRGEGQEFKISALQAAVEDTIFSSTLGGFEGCKYYGFMISSLGFSGGVEERTNIVMVQMPGENCGESLCTHLFPHARNFATGDDEFTDREEEFWRTDPTDQDTSGDGISDEAAVAGLGRDKFNWLYNTGDEVGVVVEGTAAGLTQHDDSSQMVMWALPKNIFDVRGSGSECEISGKSSYTKTIKGYNVQIDAAETDINECLKENLIDPLQGGQPGNIEVELSAFPENPANDSSGSGNGDIINVQSMLLNANVNDARNVYYKWSVYGSDQFILDLESWTEIPSIIDGMSEGLNMDSISFDLNLGQNETAFQNIFGGGNSGYLRVVLDVEENYQSGSTRSGRGEVVIKAITGNSNQLEIGNVRYSNGLLLPGTRRFCLTDPNNPNSSNETVCFITNNEIVRAEADIEGLNNYYWTLNGKKLECTGDMSNDCRNDYQTNVVYFPIVGSPGDTYTLKLFANDTVPSDAQNPGNPGFKTEIVQHFKILDPVVELGPLGGIDENCRSIGEAGFDAKLLGNYTDIYGADLDECSTTVFEGQAGSFTVEAFLNPTFISNYLEEINWSVNGESLDSDGMTVTFPAGGEAGASYQVSFNGKYRQENEVERALVEKFEVPQLSLVDEPIGDSITIKITENDETALKSRTSKAMASLISNIPIQTLFLFRVALTVATIIFVSGTVMALGRSAV
ncbi:MAG: hypothetical protein PHX98_01010, partial [Candidatus Moranbacteria bacterium]|nr:hypothetical protein [Candidatus Moranbacteria bacterium]